MCFSYNAWEYPISLSAVTLPFLADLSEAIALNPKDAEIYASRGFAYVLRFGESRRGLSQAGRQGRCDRRLADFTHAIHINPAAVDAYRHRAFSRQEAFDSQGAIEDYSHVIEVSAKDAEALRGRGLAYLHLHEHNAAIADLTAAISINPTDVRAYRYRALAYEGKNDLQHEDLDDATVRRLGTIGR